MEFAVASKQTKRIKLSYNADLYGTQQFSYQLMEYKSRMEPFIYYKSSHVCNLYLGKTVYHREKYFQLRYLKCAHL